MQEVAGEGVQQQEGPALGGDMPAQPKQTSVLRMRGLPFEATDEEIKQFFGQHKTEEVVICHRQGRPSGEAYVQFESEEAACSALATLDKANMGRRYIELFESSEEEMAARITRQRRGASCLVRLRGLPFTATAADVEAFFSGIPIARGTAGITFVYNGNGSPSGECFVEFANEQARNEGLKRDRETMGNRYVEIFAADQGDVSVAMRQNRRPGRGGYRGGRRGGHAGPGRMDDAIDMLQGLSIGQGPPDAAKVGGGRGRGGRWGSRGGRGEQPYAGMPSMDPMRGQPMMHYANPATGVFVGAPGPYMAGQQQQILPSTAQQQEQSHQHMAQGMFGLWPMQQQQLQAYRPGSGPANYAGMGFPGDALGAAPAPGLPPYMPQTGMPGGNARGGPAGAGAAGGGAPAVRNGSAQASGAAAGWLSGGSIDDLLQPSGASASGLLGGSPADEAGEAGVASTSAPVAAQPAAQAGLAIRLRHRGEGNEEAGQRTARESAARGGVAGSAPVGLVETAGLPGQFSQVTHTPSN